MAKKLKVLFVVSEAVPYAKTGGLADVAGTLRTVTMQLAAMLGRADAKADFACRVRTG